MRHSAFSQLHTIYGWHDDQRKGRSISLINTLVTSIYNVFITGIFYTGFLTIYDISLVEIGIITFISPLANCFVIFSPFILERIKKRKWILASSKIFYYLLIIVATNLMPYFVTDPGARVVWFCVLQFSASAVYAIFSTGFTPWFYSFYPDNPEQRSAYISYNQVFSSILSSATLLLTGTLSSLIENSGHQSELIIGLRYFAFLLVLIDVFFQVQAKEYPYPVHSGKIKFREIFTLPPKHHKFFLCMILTFVWTYIVYLNTGIWNYYILNTVGLSIKEVNFASALYVVYMFLFIPFWRKLVNRMGWIKTFALGVMLWWPTEIYFFFLTPVTKQLYLPGIIVQHFISVGLNLSYANIPFLNLPRENTTTHTCFHAFFCNVFAFLGLMTSTFWCSLFGEETVLYLGTVPTTAVQYTTLMRAFLMLILSIILLRKWRDFMPDN